MKRIIPFALTILLFIVLGLAFISCGDNSDTPKKPVQGDVDNPATTPNDNIPDDTPKGTLFDAGNFTVTVPDGWNAFAVNDAFGQNEVDPNALEIHKNAQTAVDLFSTPGIRVSYYGINKTLIPPGTSFYEEVQDIDPIKIGEYTWQGFSALSFDNPLIVLWTESGDHEFQLAIWTDLDGKTISLYDEDVLALIASITPN